MSNAEKSERQKEIVTAHRAALPDAKGLSNISGEKLRLNNDRKDRGHNRSPQYRQKTGPTMFNLRGVFRIATAPNFQHLSACDAFGIRQVGLSDQRAAQRD